MAVTESPNFDARVLSPLPPSSLAAAAFRAAARRCRLGDRRNWSNLADASDTFRARRGDEIGDFKDEASPLSPLLPLLLILLLLLLLVAVRVSDALVTLTLGTVVKFGDLRASTGDRLWALALASAILRVSDGEEFGDIEPTGEREVCLPEGESRVPLPPLPPPPPPPPSFLASPEVGVSQENMSPEAK